MLVRKVKLSLLWSSVMETRLESVQDCEITNLALDSRFIKPGGLFLACKGTKLEGNSFIQEAAARGAVAVFCETPVSASILKWSKVHNLQIFYLPQLSLKLEGIAASFYGYPAQKLTLIGVTGTNGKTTVTHYLATLLNRFGIASGVVGTLGFGAPGNLSLLTNTTPDPVTLQRVFADFVERGIKVVAMEVSSHALTLGRVAGLQFKVAVFTNLTRDHLDYHGNMEAYGQAKCKLFTEHQVEYAVLNADDAFGRRLAQELTGSVKQLSLYTLTENDDFAQPTFCARIIPDDSGYMVAKLSTPKGEGRLVTRLLGDFNVSNLLAVLAVLAYFRIPLQKLLSWIPELPAVPGRMETYGGQGKHPLVVIDYAHTPDALAQALSVLQHCCRGKVWCIFGCGGERDSGKRPIMGQIAELHSNHLILTNDNPRGEDPQAIIRDIVRGLVFPTRVEIEYDRTRAINSAIQRADEQDMILIAGKGHEEYQILGETILPYSDREVVLASLNL